MCITKKYRVNAAANLQALQLRSFSMDPPQVTMMWR